jgi:hypothetical protein
MDEAGRIARESKADGTATLVRVRRAARANRARPIGVRTCGEADRGYPRPCALGRFGR